MPAPELNVSTPYFEISHFTTSPEGFTFATRDVIHGVQLASGPLHGRGEQGKVAARRRELNELRLAAGQAPTDYEPIPEGSITSEEAALLRQGVQAEMHFSGASAISTALKAVRQAEKAGAPAGKIAELREKVADARRGFKGHAVGKKLGLSDINADGSILTADVRYLPYGQYRLLARDGTTPDLLRMSRNLGVAMIVRTSDDRFVIQHRGSEKVRLDDSGKTKGNAVYGDIPGASVAGMADALLAQPDRKPGTPDRPNSETFLNLIFKEGGEELGLAPEQLGKPRLIAVAQDLVKHHDEMVYAVNTSLTAVELKETSRTSNRNKSLDPFDFDEKYIDIPATPEAIEALLTEGMCPLPPTHAAALLAAAYLQVLEGSGLEAAATWLEEIEPKIAQNQRRIDQRVHDFYKTFPEVITIQPERFWNSDRPQVAPRRDVNGYDPAYTPEEQGLPDFESEMVRIGLLPETRRHVKTAYLFDVDGVLTDPDQKRVMDERNLEEVKLRLEAGIPCGLNTGRSPEWVMNNYVNELLARGLDKSDLHNLIIIGEKGGRWVTYNEDGQAHFGEVETLVVPEDLQQAVLEAAEKYAHSMGNLDPKKTMLSIEMHDRYNKKKFKEDQAKLKPELEALVKELGYADKFKVDDTAIATDIESAHVGKALGTDRFIEFLRLRNIKAESFIAFGDSESDLQMADEFARRGQDVTMIYIGDASKLQQSKIYSIVSVQGGTSGTADYLQAEREAA